MVTRATKVSLGLLATWAISDVEELLTMSRTSKQLAERLPAAVPIPAELRENGLPQREVALSIGMMGLVMGAAAACGVRSQGRSAFFRGTLLGFGLHGFGHVASVAAMRGYASGAATAPTMVIPFWLWARRELAKDGLTDSDRTTAVVALSGIPLLWVIHALAHRVLGLRGTGN